MSSRVHQEQQYATTIRRGTIRHEEAFCGDHPVSNRKRRCNGQRESGGPEKWFANLPHALRSQALSFYRRWPGIVAGGGLAILLAVAYLLAAPMGRDLSAQEVHAQLAEWQWPELLNLRWYGGFDPLGYSVLSPPIMAVLGIRLTTALAYVVSVVLFAALLKRAAVARPVLGAITVAVCLTGNLVTARTTFELGLVLGLGALLVLSYRRLRIIVVLVVLAALTSPIAGLFLGVAGGALFLAGRRRDGLIVGISAMVPTVAVGVLFCNGGHQSYAGEHALLSFLICLAVAALCWRTPVVRWGALLSAGMVAGAYLLPTPVGTNASRLPELFAAPMIPSVAAVPLVAVIAAAAAAILVLPPVSIEEIRDRGDPALSSAYYSPLLDQLVARNVEGPIEVVPTRRRGEVAAVAPVVPLARGWLRQVDIERNPVLYDGSLDTEEYRQWLDDNAVSYVALPNGPYDWAAAPEAALVRNGLPYLQAVWSDRAWTLYAVANPQPVISAPGRVIARDPVSLTVSLPESGEYHVRVWWSRYLSVSDGCVRPSGDGWSTVVAERSGIVKIEGSLVPRHC